MPQVTMYLDEETRELMTSAAQAAGVSQSRWVAELIRAKTKPTWPPDWHTCLGEFPDFPLRDDQPAAADAPRIDF